ncbi:MAG: hypothetical protein V2I51_15015, partial [Anderseniella sp.]|nr:hypothetical protein [Anderseniella sp.]
MQLFALRHGATGLLLFPELGAGQAEAQQESLPSGHRGRLYAAAGVLKGGLGQLAEAMAPVQKDQPQPERQLLGGVRDGRHRCLPLPRQVDHGQRAGLAQAAFGEIEQQLASQLGIGLGKDPLQQQIQSGGPILHFRG